MRIKVTLKCFLENRFFFFKSSISSKKKIKFCTFLPSSFDPWPHTFSFFSRLSFSLPVKVFKSNFAVMRYLTVLSLPQVRSALSPVFIDGTLLDTWKVFSLAHWRHSSSVLVDFYHATHGPKWVNKDGWLSGDPCGSQWAFVHCHNASVISLYVRVLFLSVSGFLFAIEDFFAGISRRILLWGLFLHHSAN